MEKPTPTRVLVVDDSALIRRVLTRVINDGQNLEVIGAASTGLEALSRIRELRPDVVTLDVEMPEMDGVQALERIMQRYPVPVVMLSSLTRRGAEITLRCLELGAVDFIPKPSADSGDLTSIRYVIWQKLRAAAHAHVSVRTLPIVSGQPQLRAEVPAPDGLTRPAKRLVVVGASTGGPRALLEVLSQLPGTLPAAVLAVQHMPPNFTAEMARRFDANCAMHIREAKQGDVLNEGTVLVAPGGQHLRLAVDRTVRLTDEPPRWGVRPAADLLFEDAALRFRSACLGVILTGMGRDGTQGLGQIKQNAGTTIAEHESTCVVYGMPRSAIEAGVVDQVCPLPDIAAAIIGWCGK